MKCFWLMYYASWCIDGPNAPKGLQLGNCVSESATQAPNLNLTHYGVGSESLLKWIPNTENNIMLCSDVNL